MFAFLVPFFKKFLLKLYLSNWIISLIYTLGQNFCQNELFFLFTLWVKTSVKMKYFSYLQFGSKPQSKLIIYTKGQNLNQNELFFFFTLWIKISVKMNYFSSLHFGSKFLSRWIIFLLYTLGQHFWLNELLFLIYT